MYIAHVLPMKSKSALPALAPNDPVALESRSEEWDRRSTQLREQEWEMAQRLLTAARALLRRVVVRPEPKSTVNDVARMLDLASRLGRLATGLETERTEVTGPAGGPISVEVEFALRKVYGEPLPGEVVDVEAIPASEKVNPESMP
jgi:hypothetical protein